MRPVMRPMQMTAAMYLSTCVMEVSFLHMLKPNHSKDHHRGDLSGINHFSRPDVSCCGGRLSLLCRRSRSICLAAAEWIRSLLPLVSSLMDAESRSSSLHLQDCMASAASSPLVLRTLVGFADSAATQTCQLRASLTSLLTGSTLVLIHLTFSFSIGRSSCIYHPEAENMPRLCGCFKVHPDLINK